jgi:NhaP-type Na+/H+ or K+/H+ antiporter
VELGANGFVAAFVAGLAYGSAERRNDEHTVEKTLELTHQGGQLLSFTVWFMFGAVMVPELVNVRWEDVLFAILALSALRMVPVWLALLGVGFDRSTVAVIGWFGPRGLASVVFALLAVGDLAPAEGNRVLVVITTTVIASVVLHGASAAPIAQRYASRHERVREGVTR